MQPLRLAFEAARTTVTLCESSQYAGWFGDQLGWLFGPAVEQEFQESRARLLFPDGGNRPSVEQARWWARFRDLLEARPERGERLLTLVTQARQAMIEEYRSLPV